MLVKSIFKGSTMKYSTGVCSYYFRHSQWQYFCWNYYKDHTFYLISEAVMVENIGSKAGQNHDF